MNIWKKSMNSEDFSNEQIQWKIKHGIFRLRKALFKISIIAKLVQNKEPDEIILSAIGSHLHSYYNGIKKIFEIINKETDNFSFNSDRSHSELLLVMAMKTDKRNAVISEQSKNELSDYMKFRHFFRHIKMPFLL